MSKDCVVTLNVGGSIFLTRKSTLTRFDGYLKDSFENNGTGFWDRNGYPFVDRDPTYFRYILNFLRDGTEAIFPDDEQIIWAITNEAKFYGLVELVNFIS